MPPRDASEPTPAGSGADDAGLAVMAAAGARLTLMRARRRLEVAAREAEAGTGRRTAATIVPLAPLLRPLPPPAS